MLYKTLDGARSGVRVRQQREVGRDLPAEALQEGLVVVKNSGKPPHAVVAVSGVTRYRCYSSHLQLYAEMSVRTFFVY